MKSNKKTTADSRKRFTFFDGVIIAFFVILAAFIGVRAVTAEIKGLEVVVKKDSEVIYSEVLENIDAPREICIDEDFHVIILVEDDGVTVVSSDCEDRVCINTGKLTRAGQSAVCLPAHISVELKGENDSQLDGVVG